MFDTTGKIAIAQLAFFVAAILPAQYVLFKHGLKGLLGWLFITLFCVIRIIGAALIIHDESGHNPISEAALIISSVAIAPMIIALGGIAHESFGSIELYRPFLFGWAPDLITHVITIGAIVMLVIGFLNFEGTNKSAQDMKTGLDLIRAGGVVLIGVWAMITAIVLLAVGVSVAVICLIVRILYTVLSAFINTASFNFRTGGTLAEHIVLDVLPEFILVLALLTAGIMSRNLKYEAEAALRSKDSQHPVEERRRR
ncbi:hypothetical protein D0Z07_8251 [Hyphodiscus hymeniophilus]|uniref:DUF7702 domain-containing protein n=1 Tax=Hyphodiscus hymeniophilus TaxID=353542 RepID=A0A9P6VEF6_9HELO|nr:hypothetical protein D0Z07_8251 [Hyphodiscus hymeniophilus]